MCARLWIESMKLYAATSVGRQFDYTPSTFQWARMSWTNKFNGNHQSMLNCYFLFFCRIDWIKCYGKLEKFSSNFYVSKQQFRKYFSTNQFPICFQIGNDWFMVDFSHSIINLTQQWNEMWCFTARNAAHVSVEQKFSYIYSIFIVSAVQMFLLQIPCA